MRACSRFYIFDSSSVRPADKEAEVRPVLKMSDNLLEDCTRNLEVPRCSKSCQIVPEC